MAKMVVSLFKHIGTSLLVKWPTGVFFTLQTAGNFCLNPEDEGWVHVVIHRTFEGFIDYSEFPQKGILIWTS